MWEIKKIIKEIATRTNMMALKTIPAYRSKKNIQQNCSIGKEN
jgi:hypothetical protein